ncbi:hypothetical protein HMPREF9607_00687 [Cutibacterium modestum HL044PA1]|uniref:Uncharacterized protein n=1 Tax=Cutibacterium modestum HL044PA1 TaxID=765109 RepID=A0ABP2K804_9ACTN|nr:hypothetical protein HMPREF9607_00687 [Cutibacterium modestum HL044PA1]
MKDFLPGVTGIISDRVVTGSTSQTVVVEAVPSPTTTFCVIPPTH